MAVPHGRCAVAGRDRSGQISAFWARFAVRTPSAITPGLIAGVKGDLKGSESMFAGLAIPAGEKNAPDARQKALRRGQGLSPTRTRSEVMFPRGPNGGKARRGFPEAFLRAASLKRFTMNACHPSR